MQILPIASGKGGVGKSLVASNLAIALGQAGKKVILADLDLGASNIHLVLGMPTITKGIGTFIGNPDIELGDIIIDSGYDNVKFIPGDAEIPGMANLKSSQKRSLIRKLSSLDADYLILDLGAGTNNNILDFFLSSSQGIIVSAPTLTATLNAYLFLKNAVFRIMSTCFRKESDAWKYLENLRKDGKSLQRVYIPKLLERMRDIDAAGYDEFELRITHFHPGLIMNLLEDPKDGHKAQKIRRSCKEYLGIDLEHLGIMYRDHLQDVALNSRLPIVVYKPQSVLSQGIFRIADKILTKYDDEEAPLDLQDLDDTYTAADMEAEIDFDVKIHELETLLHSGALSHGDLIETIKIQQFELSRLKKENVLLKSRIVKAINAGYTV